MSKPSDSAPDRALPPVTSSALQVNTRRTAHAATSHANEAFAPIHSSKPAAPPVRRVETTLGVLAAELSEGLLEEQEFDPAAYLRRSSSTTSPRTGASLAAAALKKLGGKR